MRRTAVRGVVLLALSIATLVVVSVADAAVVKKTPSSAYQANGTVRVTIVVGNTTYLGGQFTAMQPNGGGTAVTRNGAAAVSTATGALRPVEPERERHRVRDDRQRRQRLPRRHVHHRSAARPTRISWRSAAHHRHRDRPGGHRRSPTRSSRTRRCAVWPSPRPATCTWAARSPRRDDSPLEVNAITGALIPAFAPVIANSLGTSAEVRAIAVNPSGTRVILGGFFNQPEQRGAGRSRPDQPRCRRGRCHHRSVAPVGLAHG